MTPEHYIILVLIAVASFLAGIGVSHVKVAGKVGVHESQIAAIQADFEEERKRTDTRLFEVVRLVEKSLEQNGEVIKQNTKFLARLGIIE